MFSFTVLQLQRQWFYTRLMILSQLWSNFDVLSLRALNCLGKWKFIILMSDCVHTLSRIEYEWIRMNFLRWFSVFLLVPYSIISALLLILHSCISYVLSYQYTVFLGPIQKVQHSSLWYQYLFSFKMPFIKIINSYLTFFDQWSKIHCG